MFVKVKYYKEDLAGYGGREYTFSTKLPLIPYQKVLVPSNDGEPKKALVTEVNLAESEIIGQPWANYIKEIKEIDKG